MVKKRYMKKMKYWSTQKKFYNPIIQNDFEDLLDIQNLKLGQYGIHSIETILMVI